MLVPLMAAAWRPTQRLLVVRGLPPVLVRQQGVLWALSCGRREPARLPRRILVVVSAAQRHHIAMRKLHYARAPQARISGIRVVISPHASSTWTPATPANLI